MEYARPEIELLLRCASPGWKRHTDRIRELSGQTLDQEYLLRLAGRHGLAPLLYWGLKAARPEAIPEVLARKFQDNLRNSVALTGELFQLMDLLTREGIRVLPFKGPTLAAAAYRNLALREFGDLDLLVAKEQAVRAREILLGNGYRTKLELPAKWHEAYLRAYDEFVLYGADEFPLVELHWAVTPGYFSVPLAIAPFWERAVRVPVGSREALSLCADDLLLVLCVHATKHCWSQLSMVSDVAWLVASCEIRWKDVMHEARRLGSLRMLLLGAGLAGTLLEAPLPPPVVQSIEADREIAVLVAQVFARIFEVKSTRSTILGAGAFHIKARERWQDRVRYFARLTTRVGVEDWQGVDLPVWLAFLYSLLRFPRLLRKYWMRIP